MKKVSNKLLRALSIGFLSLIWTSCVSDLEEDGEYRLHSMSEENGLEYVYHYDALGRVSAVTSDIGEWQFFYEGQKLEISFDGVVEYSISLEEGFASEISGEQHTWSLEYEGNYLVEGWMDGSLVTSQNIVDGNISWWTKYDAENDFWMRKEAAYLNRKNLGDIHTHYAESLKLPRWLWETGLLGCSSVDVLQSSIWNYYEGYSDKTAVYSYKYNSSGLITKECKYYGIWNETDLTGMDEDTQTTFTWEKIK